MIAISSLGTRSKQLLGVTTILIILTITGLSLPASDNTRLVVYPIDYTAPAIKCPQREETRWAPWFSTSPSSISEVVDAPPDSILTASAEGYAQAYLASLIGPVNTTYYHDEHGLNLGNTDLKAYTLELIDNYNQYFSGTHGQSRKAHAAWMAAVKSRLSLRPPTSPLPDRPKQVITTDKSIRAIPREFRRWNQVMPDWNTRYFDDAGLMEWVDVIFGGSKAQTVWEALPRRVLQTDVFRYMAMLVEGGIYTDSDTAPVSHADRWGQPYENITPTILTHLSRILSLTSSGLVDGEPNPFERHSRSAGRDAFSEPAVLDGNELGEPALVISIEADAIEFGWADWRERHMTRAVQMTQWTFMARPGHPVFLDAIGRTLRQAEEVARQQQEAKVTRERFVPPSAVTSLSHNFGAELMGQLEWTGPGVFSDCVYRYLLTRYGVHPEELVGRKEPFRIGDVLILPAGSFSSVSPFTDEPQRPFAATWHGFAGRWREEDPQEHAGAMMQNTTVAGAMYKFGPGRTGGPSVKEE